MCQGRCRDATAILVFGCRCEREQATVWAPAFWRGGRLVPPSPEDCEVQMGPSAQAIWDAAALHRPIHVPGVTTLLVFQRNPVSAQHKTLGSPVLQSPPPTYGMKITARVAPASSRTCPQTWQVSGLSCEQSIAMGFDKVNSIGPRKPSSSPGMFTARGW